MTTKTPGCYGVPSIFSFNSPVCPGCMHFEGCKDSSRDALKRLPDSPGVRLALSRFVTVTEQEPMGRKLITRAARVPKRMPLTEDQLAKVAELPKKAGEYLRTLFSKGMDTKVVEAAKNGENPFCKDKARPYHLAFDQLLEGGFTKGFLRVSLIETLGWSESSAFSQVSIIWNVFQALGVAQEQGCALVPTPNVRCKNSVIQYDKV